MKLLGLNSPEIFIILVILISILGPKRVEKGFLLFKKLLKFLLSKEDNPSLEDPKIISGESKKSEVKEEAIEAEIKSEESEESEVKEEIVEAEVKSIKPKKRTVKDEIIDDEVGSDNK